MKYHEVSFKQSHNSYDRDEDSHVTLTFHSDDLGNAGCRGLEYDIWRHSDATGGRSVGYFTVAHTGGGGPPFASYLGYLLSWHLANPRHDVIFVTVDIKSSGGSKEVFPDEIDTYMRVWFNEKLVFTPRHLSPLSDDFVAYVKKNGWPEVDSLRGRFIFCLSGNNDWKSYYAKTNARRRLCFADADFDDSKRATVPTRGQRIIYSSTGTGKTLVCLACAVTGRCFAVGLLDRHKGPFLLPSRVSDSLKATVEEFYRAYDAAAPDEQAALRVWMRKIGFRLFLRSPRTERNPPRTQPHF